MTFTLFSFYSLSRWEQDNSTQCHVACQFEGEKTKKKKNMKGKKKSEQTEIWSMLLLMLCVFSGIFSNSFRYGNRVTICPGLPGTLGVPGTFRAWTWESPWQNGLVGHPVKHSTEELKNVPSISVTQLDAHTSPLAVFIFIPPNPEAGVSTSSDSPGKVLVNHVTLLKASHSQELKQSY